MYSSEDYALNALRLYDGNIRGTNSVAEFNRDVNALASNINVVAKVYSCVDANNYPPGVPHDSEGG